MIEECFSKYKWRISNKSKKSNEEIIKGLKNELKNKNILINEKDIKINELENKLKEIKLKNNIIEKNDEELENIINFMKIL